MTTWCDKVYPFFQDKEKAQQFLLDNLTGRVGGERKNCPALTPQEKQGNKPSTMFAWARENQVPLEQVQACYHAIKAELPHVRDLCTPERAAGFGGKDAFFAWYITQDLHCAYCGVKEEELGVYFGRNTPQLAGARKRGLHLEIERKKTAGKDNVYSPGNCTLACYICNNAKSDFISPEDFVPIAAGIKDFWRQQKEACLPQPKAAPPKGIV